MIRCRVENHMADDDAEDELNDPRPSMPAFGRMASLTLVDEY
jgi:hypothetical protein